MKNSQDLVGKKLGDYVLLRKLTSGGMAHIYIGEDQKLQRQAAIKILTSDMSGNDAMLRERFEREARAIAKLEHDNIVPIYQFGEQDNLYFIAMRFIEGNDLSDEIKKYKDVGQLMPVGRALSILEQVAAALDYAHKRGIIHRDIKPSNVLLGADDKAVLSDFGLVLWEDVDKTLGTAFGTPRYISPEQATDSQSAVPQSDIYSLAVIVYEILTGEVVFKGNTPMEVALSHITEKPTPPRALNPDIPQNAQIEVMKSLQKDPGKRHHTASEFIKALRSAYNLDGTNANKPSATEHVGTIAMRPDDEASTNDLFDSWDRVPAPTGDAKPANAKQSRKKAPASLDTKPLDQVLDEPVTVKPKSSPRAERPQQTFPMPMLLLVGGLIVAAIVGFIVTSGVFSGASDNMFVVYNENYFAVINRSTDQILDIQNLSVQGANGETAGARFGTSLEPGQCVFVHRSNVQASDVPSSWGCTPPARRQESASALYWRADDATDRNFSIMLNGRLVTTCNTVGRVVNNAQETSCAVDWSASSLIEGD